MVERNDDYFTPDIEDIRVGYECEINVNGRWLIHIFGGIDSSRADDWYNLHRMHDATKTIENYIRVPYLSKEQIEAEKGFEIVQPYAGSKHPYNGTILRKGNYWFSFQELPLWDEKGQTGEHKMYLTIIPIDPVASEIDINSHFPRFHGECKDINTFRNICKILNIG